MDNILRSNIIDKINKSDKKEDVRIKIQYLRNIIKNEHNIEIIKNSKKKENEIERKKERIISKKEYTKYRYRDITMHKNKGNEGKREEYYRIREYQIGYKNGIIIISIIREIDEHGIPCNIKYDEISEIQCEKILLENELILTIEEINKIKTTKYEEEILGTESEENIKLKVGEFVKKINEYDLFINN